MKNRDSLKMKKDAANLSVASNLSLALIKLVVGIASSSLSVISEAIHSGVDLVAALIARYAVVGAMKPPDEDHKFGHGKLENIGSLVEALLIFVVGIIIIYSSIKRILAGADIRYLRFGVVIMLCSSVVNFIVSKKVKKVARLTDSQALEADAFHMLTDVYTSVGIMLGLIIITVGGYFGVNLVVIDPIMAMLIAVYIACIAVGLVRKAMGVLVDKKIPEEDEKKVISVLERHYGELLSYHSLRTRKSGSTKHVDLHIIVSKDKHVHEAHDLCDRLETEIRSELPDTDIVIHVEPCDERCDTCEHYHRTCKKD